MSSSRLRFTRVTAWWRRPRRSSPAPVRSSLRRSGIRWCSISRTPKTLRLSCRATPRRDLDPMIIDLNPEHPQPRRIDQVVEVLKNEKLVAYPTDTVYGIGCDIFNKKAVEKLHRLVAEIKGAPDHSPLAFICRDLSNIAEYAVVSDYAYRSLRRMLPGPYTFVLPATRSE